jgi:hypothetical protein
MSDASPEFSKEGFDRGIAHALAKSLRQYPQPLNEAEQLILDVIIHLLTDPIEQLKLSPKGQFSEDEEAALQKLEQSARRLP